MSLKQLALRHLPDSVLKPIRARHYQRQLKRYNIDDEPDLLGCRQFLGPGDVVLDIGANIGVYTRFCSEFVGPKGHVFSLEPMPETFSYLARNVRKLGLSNVVCHNVAASGKDTDHGRMKLPSYATGGANLYEAFVSDSGDIPIKCARLDTLFYQPCAAIHQMRCRRSRGELYQWRARVDCSLPSGVDGRDPAWSGLRVVQFSGL